MAKINTKFTFEDNVTPGLEKVRKSAKSASNGFSDMANKLLSVNSAIQIFSAVSRQFGKITASVNECVQAYQYQSEQELKLSTIMRQRMGATEDDIKAIKDFASAQQQAGIYGDELILQGAQELASFTSSKEAIETLIPAMNNLIAQQYGYSASGQQFQSTADMMGKVLSGQTGALSRLGYVFSDEEKAMLEAGDEMQRAATLAKIITDNVGEMNQALAGTNAGKVQSLANDIGDLKEEIGGTLQTLKSSVSSLKSTVTADFLNMVNNILKKVVPVINRIIKAFQDIYTKARPYLQKLADFMQNVVGKAIDFIVKHLDDIVKGLAIVASVMVAKALIMAGAWALVNWKILLIVGALALIVKILNSFGVGLEDIGRFVGGFFAGAFATVYNIVADIYNLFMSVGDLIDDIGKHPLQALSNFLADILKFFLGGLENGALLIDGIGEKLGKDWDFAGPIQKAMKALDDSKFKSDELTQRTPMTKKTAEDFANMVSKGADLGASVGAGLEDATGMIKDAYFGITSDEDLKDAVEGGMGDLLKVNGDGTLAVSDKNLVNIADDYRDLLSKQATERFNLKFSQVTPQVTFGDVNMNSEEESENILEKFVDKLTEVASSHLGG